MGFSVAMSALDFAVSLSVSSPENITQLYRTIVTLHIHLITLAEYHLLTFVLFIFYFIYLLLISLAYELGHLEVLFNDILVIN